ncbi:MAG: glycosyltransferase [Candidatus Aenigmarchaeota archaeon]|nr:glycosyltransferase [Candidatus Aenigmarchaeota archaeon]
MEPMFSVVIPTLNEEKNIAHCILALRNQDYEEKYEIIVADGMSKDNTIKIAKRYADKVIQVRKKGISVGRNAGAKVARGRILLFVDADTLATPNLLTELSKAFRRKDVVGATCYVFPLSTEIGYQLFLFFYNQFVKASVKTKTPQVGGMCCAYRKDSFERVGGFDENLRTVEDLDLSKRIAKLGKIKFVENTFVLTSMRRIKKWGKIKAVKKHIVNYFKFLLKYKPYSTKEWRPIRSY